MEIMGLVLSGILGMIWFAGAFFKKGFPNNKNLNHNRIATIAIAIVFSLKFFHLFSIINSARPLELFALAGYTLGLIACARLIYIFFLQIEKS
jgi:hypothetical protein